MNEALKSKIDAAVACIGSLSTKQGQEKCDRLMDEAMQMATTKEEKREAGQYLRKALKLRQKRPDVDVKEMLGGLADILPYSYIAKSYFGKTRPWLSQRINRSIVNGKEECFTGNELIMLSEAARDLSHQLSEFHLKVQESLRP